MTYWRDEPYLAVGAGAAASWAGRRFKHTPNVRRYLAAVAAGREDLEEDERPDWRTAVEDHLALGLRLREGLDPHGFAARFGLSLEALLGAELGQLLGAGVLEWSEGRLRVAEAHIMVTNEILARLRAALERRLPRVESSC